MRKAKKGKNTSRALTSAIIGTFLCIAMLFGTTFAWFTSTIQTGTNTIKTADFNVKLQYCDTYDGTYADLTASDVLFNDVTLVPGGKTDVKYIKITNNNDYAVEASAAIGEVTTTGGDNEMKLAYRTVTSAVNFGDDDFTNSLSATEILNNQTLAQNESVIVAIQVLLPLDAESAGVTNSFTIMVGTTQSNT